ncbi:MAG: cell division protein FtsQ [Alphaproteobacteria bacterium]|nr:cell division protein FtsQ [Alphaproteobacteria bacterium]
MTTLKDFPAIASLMKAATRVGERRWNLYLQPNILVRLPEQDMAAALARLARLDRDQKVLSKNLVAIDLRLPDRLALEPASPSQAEPTKESRP